MNNYTEKERGGIVLVNQRYWALSGEKPANDAEVMTNNMCQHGPHVPKLLPYHKKTFINIYNTHHAVFFFLFISLCLVSISSLAFEYFFFLKKNPFGVFYQRFFLPLSTFHVLIAFLSKRITLS